jgi:large subunit ribosomal protein L22
MEKRMKNEIKKTAEAHLKSVRISPIKLSAVARSITGMPVNKAVMVLTFSKKAVAKDVNMLLKSAMANAENNHGLDIDNLFIHRIDVGKSMVMKRFRARAKGRGARILKPFSNIRIVLIEKLGE